MPSGSKKRKAAKKKKEAAHHHHHHHSHNHHHQHHPHSADVHSHGDDDLKHHDDDKESDAEEVSSPASQEHPNNHHQFTDEEKEEVEKSEDKFYVQASSKSSGRLKEDNEAAGRTITEEQVVKHELELKPPDVELNSNDRIVGDFDPQKKANAGVLLQSLDKERVVPIETDLKPASDEGSSKNEIVENVESRNEKNHGVLLQSLDEGSVVQIETESKPDSDELNSRTAFVENVEPKKNTANEVLLPSIEEKSVVQIETDSKRSSDEINSMNAIMENVESQKEANGGSMSQSLDQVGVAQIEADLRTSDEPETKNITIDEPETKNITVEHAEHLKVSNDGDLLTQTQHEEPHAMDKTIFVVDNAQFVNSTEAVNSLSKGLPKVSNSTEVGENHNSSGDTGSADEMGQVKLPDEKINGNTSVSTDSHGEMKGNGEKEVIIKERIGKMSSSCMDLGPKNRGDEAVVKADEILATSDAKVSAACEIGEKLTASGNVPEIETATGADSSHSKNYVEHLKDPEVPKSSDCQASVPSAPRAVQRTSWMSCCGLFEVFARSDN